MTGASPELHGPLLRGHCRVLRTPGASNPSLPGGSFGACFGTYPPSNNHGSGPTASWNTYKQEIVYKQEFVSGSVFELNRQMNQLNQSDMEGSDTHCF